MTKVAGRTKCWAVDALGTVLGCIWPLRGRQWWQTAESVGTKYFVVVTAKVRRPLRVEEFSVAAVEEDPVGMLARDGERGMSYRASVSTGPTRERAATGPLILPVRQWNAQQCQALDAVLYVVYVMWPELVANSSASSLEDAQC